MAKKIEVIMATFFIATCILFCFAMSAIDLPHETPDPPHPSAPLPTPKVAKALNKLATLLGTVNAAMGSFSRSKTVKTVSQSMRGDSEAELQEGLDQAITTLAVLDVGGGIISPVVAHLVESIATVDALSNTKKALENFGNTLPQFADELDDLSDDVIKSRLNKMKQVVLNTFKTDVDHNGLRYMRESDALTLKYIRKTKRLLRVKTLAGVLAPIFDIAAVGINSWALHTTLRDCRKDPETCNRGAIASASLSIAAGFVGLGTFVAVFKMTATAGAIAGPAGAIVAALLGITATCIELSYTPRIASENRLKEAAMKELDTYAKEELYNATTKYTKNDLYVVNQGHLPKWFTYDPPKNSVQFGLDGNEPRRYSPADHNHECSHPHWGAVTTPSHYLPGRKIGVCPYLVDGNEFISTRDHPLPAHAPDNRGLGYDFYGLAKDYRQYKQNEGPPDNESPYNGATVLVSTNKVQPVELEKRELSANLRGLNINTGGKGGDEPFDDLVAIGDMPSLDAGEMVIVRTGSGNDALNIDGRLGPFTSADVLDASLGEEGQNTLNFGAIASSYGIEGIVFDARTGMVQYKYDSGQQQNVGRVMHVQILEASSFDDEITLHSNRPGPEGFTVFKFKGLATYKIDISSLSTKKDTRYFTIIDSSSPLDSDEGRVPVLELVNFGENAKANDIQYRKEGILVYGERTEESHDVEDEGKSRERQVVVDERECDGETGGNPIIVSSDKKVKKLLAIITLAHERLIKIEAKSSNGICVMKRREQLELDTRFFPGKRLHVDFSERNYDGSEDDDYALLKCPLSTVDEPTTINLGDGENDYLVIGEHLFIDPCGIDSLVTTMRLARHRTLENAWNLVLAGPDLEKFTEEARTITLIGVEKILNEHGDIVLALTDSPTHNLNGKYTDMSRNDLRKWAEAARTKEIKDNIMTCIDGTGDLSPEEREELCSQGDEDEDENEDENDEETPEVQ